MKSNLTEAQIEAKKVLKKISKEESLYSKFAAIEIAAALKKTRIALKIFGEIDNRYCDSLEFERFIEELAGQNFNVSKKIFYKIFEEYKKDRSSSKHKKALQRVGGKIIDRNAFRARDILHLLLEEHIEILEYNLGGSRTAWMLRGSCKKNKLLKEEIAKLKLCGGVGTKIAKDLEVIISSPKKTTGDLKIHLEKSKDNDSALTLSGYFHLAKKDPEFIKKFFKEKEGDGTLEKYEFGIQLALVSIAAGDLSLAKKRFEEYKKNDKCKRDATMVAVALGEDEEATRLIEYSLKNNKEPFFGYREYIRSSEGTINGYKESFKGMEAFLFRSPDLFEKLLDKCFEDRSCYGPSSRDADLIVRFMLRHPERKGLLYKSINYYMSFLGCGDDRLIGAVKIATGVNDHFLSIMSKEMVKKIAEANGVNLARCVLDLVSGKKPEITKQLMLEWERCSYMNLYAWERCSYMNLYAVAASSYYTVVC